MADKTPNLDKPAQAPSGSVPLSQAERAPLPCPHPPQSSAVILFCFFSKTYSSLSGYSVRFLTHLSTLESRELLLLHLTNHFIGPETYLVAHRPRPSSLQIMPVLKAVSGQETKEPPPIMFSPASPTRMKKLRETVSQPVFASFIAGGAAGAVSRTVVSPLERLKILFQVQSAGRTEYKMSVGKALVKMWREEGWRGLMAGNGTNCVRIVPYSAVQFGSYNFYKRFFEDKPGAQLGPYQRLLCGGMAGITSVSFTYPLDIVRTRLSIQSASFQSLADKSNMGMFRTMSSMYKTEGGVVALYRGIVPTVAGVAPYVGLNFMVYEAVRSHFTYENEQNPGPFRKLAAGAISGAVAQTCTYPFDVLRRRFQINTMSGMGYRYKSIWDAIKIIIAQEGLKGMYKGIVPNLLKVAPSMASSWLSFEYARDFLVELKS